MSTILTIAKHEVLRFRSRFQGKTRLSIAVMTVAAMLIFFFISMSGLVLSKGFYAVGVSPDVPTISDQRFNVFTAERSSGVAMLRNKVIDTYITSSQAFSRHDSRSQYTAGALKQYLEKKELVRIANEYDIDRSFPLRVEVNYLKPPADGSTAAKAVSLSDIIAFSQTPPGAETESSSAIIATSPSSLPSLSDEAVKQQMADIGSEGRLHQFKAEFASNKEIIVPSLMNPPIPLAQVLLAFFYVVPIFLVIVFFTSSFIEEKLNRRLSILLSAPVRPVEIIVGKMLPYLAYSVLVVISITVFLKGNVLLALAIFIPVILFIFAIYLGVALGYRTFKDQTFFSLLAVTGITGFLVFPAMFTGINELSYISPLSLAVQLYRGEQFGAAEYFFSTGPMYLIFVLAMTVGVRIFNEEYLLNFKPLHTKVGEAIFFALDRKHLMLSIFILSLLLIPVVFMVELGGIALAFNLPMPFALWLLLGIGVAAEELAKSCGIAVLVKNGLVSSWRKAVVLALVSAIAFFLGEKALLYLSLTVISESIFTTALFSTNLLWLPLLAHAVATTIVSLITYRLGVRYYLPALLIGASVHLIYNISVMGMVR